MNLQFKTVCWGTPVNPELGRLKQEDYFEFLASLGDWRKKKKARL